MAPLVPNWYGPEKLSHLSTGGRAFLLPHPLPIGCQMKKVFLPAAVLMLALSTSAHADDTGLASIHDWRKEGGRTCMSDHFHDGAGSGDSRKAAEAKAIASWVSFTAFEYGTIWGNYNIAGSKKVDCTETGAKSWSCSLTARACKPGGAAVARKKK